MIESFLFLLGLIAGAGLMLLYLIKIRNQYIQTKLEKENIEKDQHKLFSENQKYQQEKNFWIEQLTSSKKDNENLQKELGSQKQVYEDKLNIQKNYYEDKIQERKEHFNKLEKKSKDVFENLANKIFSENREESTKNISQILEPFKKDIDNFKKSVDGQEKFLSETITRFSNINSELAQALKGNIKTQGNWGEVVLGNILEKSGLREGEDFFLQAKGLKLKSDQSSSLKPDAVIKLPENKYFIIDSKVSFTYYNEYISSETEEHLTKFLSSVSTHIDNLSAKKYEFAEDIKTSGFTLMFIPNEGMFSLAIQNKKGLFEKAWEKSIVIVGPTTLMATLRTVASIWKIEKQNKHTKEIAKQGRLLYDRFSSFLEDMSKIDMGLKTARDSYDKALIKIKDGNRSLLKSSHRLEKLENKLEKKENTSEQKPKKIENKEKSLLETVQNLKELGVKPKKEMPTSFIE